MTVNVDLSLHKRQEGAPTSIVEQTPREVALESWQGFVDRYGGHVATRAIRDPQYRWTLVRSGVVARETFELLRMPLPVGTALASE